MLHDSLSVLHVPTAYCSSKLCAASLDIMLHMWNFHLHMLCFHKCNSAHDSLTAAISNWVFLLNDDSTWDTHNGTGLVTVLCRAVALNLYTKVTKGLRVKLPGALQLLYAPQCSYFFSGLSWTLQQASWQVEHTHAALYKSRICAGNPHPDKVCVAYTVNYRRHKQAKRALLPSVMNLTQLP